MSGHAFGLPLVCVVAPEESHGCPQGGRGEELDVMWIGISEMVSLSLLRGVRVSLPRLGNRIEHLTFML